MSDGCAQFEGGDDAYDTSIEFGRILNIEGNRADCKHYMQPLVFRSCNSTESVRLVATTGRSLFALVSLGDGDRV